MRVFYPISARISDFTDDGDGRPSAGMMLWSVLCIALLTLVVLALPLFEKGAANQQHELYSSDRVSHVVHIRATHAKHCIDKSRTSKSTVQDYINAHQCALNISCFGAVKANQLSVVPAKSKAGGDLYL